jgi:hypothetical protein
MQIILAIIMILASSSVYSARVGIPPAYHKIANVYQIPVDVFYAVMLQESGKSINSTGLRQHLPWPWVLNVELKPYFFDTRENAAVALQQFLAINKKARIAVGLGQIYLPSHGHLFADKTRLLDPGVNLHYAAKILSDEFQWTRMQAKPNWWVAVGRYHTPSNSALAKTYREGVYRRCLKISDFCTHYGAI